MHSTFLQDLPSVQSLLRKHENVEADIDSHFRSVQDIRRDGESIMHSDCDVERADIERRIRDLEERYEGILVGHKSLKTFDQVFQVS